MGKHKQLGELETSVNGLLNASKSNVDEEPISFPVHRHDNKIAGRVEIMVASIHGGSRSKRSNGSRQNQEMEQMTQQMRTASVAKSVTSPDASMKPPRPEFIDYLTGGCQISLAVAIDFTASNGDPRVPGTPHYFHTAGSKQWNDYEKAIFAVGSILAKYDSDNKFPVWGFGAKYNDKVRHCFQCGTDVEVEGVQGIMDAYRGVFRTPLRMSFPTKFNEVIRTAAGYAQHEQVSLGMYIIFTIVLLFS